MEDDLSLADLQHTKDELATVEEEIAAEEEKFNTAVAQLRERKKDLEARLADGLRAELSAIEASPFSKTSAVLRSTGKMDEKKIVAAVRKRPGCPAGYIFDQIDGSALGISPASLSQKLKSMVERGILAKEGEKRGTRYRLP